MIAEACVGEWEVGRSIGSVGTSLRQRGRVLELSLTLPSLFHGVAALVFRFIALA